MLAKFLNQKVRMNLHCIEYLNEIRMSEGGTEIKIGTEIEIGTEIGIDY